MAHSRKQIIEMMGKVNHDQNLSISNELIKRVAGGAEKYKFDPAKISVRSIGSALKENGEVAGKNKQLAIGVKCLTGAIQILDMQKQQKEEEILEAVVPDTVKEKIRELEEAHAASLKEVRIETGKVYSELNTRFLAQSNQNMDEQRAKYEKRIELLKEESTTLRAENDNLADQIAVALKQQQDMSGALQSLEKENADLKKRVGEQESLETVITDLRERLDAYEKANKAIGSNKNVQAKK